jgi:hypothetical protein
VCALVCEIGVGFRPAHAIAFRVIGDFGHSMILRSKRQATQPRYALPDQAIPA